MAFGFCGFVVVEGFLDVPRFYIGAHCLSSRDGAVNAHLSFMELSSLHVEVCDLYFHAAYFRVKTIRDKETFQIACCSLVKTVESYCRAYNFDECQGICSQGDYGICRF